MAKRPSKKPPMMSPAMDKKAEAKMSPAMRKRMEGMMADKKSEPTKKGRRPY